MNVTAAVSLANLIKLLSDELLIPEVTLIINFCLSNGNFLKSNSCLKKPTPLSDLTTLNFPSLNEKSTTESFNFVLFFKPFLTSSSYLNSLYSIAFIGRVIHSETVSHNASSLSLHHNQNYF